MDKFCGVVSDLKCFSVVDTASPRGRDTIRKFHYFPIKFDTIKTLKQSTERKSFDIKRKFMSNAYVNQKLVWKLRTSSLF